MNGKNVMHYHSGEICKGCGYVIIPCAEFLDRFANNKGYCCHGCYEFVMKLNQWNQKAAGENR